MNDSKSQTPKSAKHRRGCCLFIFIGMFLFMLLLSVNLPYGRLFQRELVIDKATFFITEPILPDGGVDYATVMDELDSDGVTPENNAVVKLLEIVPIWNPAKDSSVEIDGEIDIERSLEQLKKGLGIPELPKVRRIVPPDQILLKKFGGGTEKERGQYQTKLNQQQIDVLQPWKGSDFPKWADALAESEASLAILEEASKRAKLFQPAIYYYFVGERNPISISRTGLVDLSWQDESSVLRMHAMKCLGEEDSSGFLRDTKTMRRLGVLIGNSSVFNTFLFDWIASDCEELALSRDSISEAQIDDYLTFLIGNRVDFDLADKLLRRRLYRLQILQSLQKYGSEYRINWKAFDPTPTDIKMLQDSSDLLETMRLVNKDFNTLTAAIDVSDDLATLKRIADLEDEILSQLVKEAGVANHVANLAKGPRSRGRIVWRRQCLSHYQFARLVAELKIKVDMRWELSFLTFLLEKERMQTGNYPPTLDLLLKKHSERFIYLTMANKKLIYERDENGFSVGFDLREPRLEYGDWKVIVAVDRINRGERRSQAWESIQNEKK